MVYDVYGKFCVVYCAQWFTVLCSMLMHEMACMVNGVLQSMVFGFAAFYMVYRVEYQIRLVYRE